MDEKPSNGHILNNIHSACNLFDATICLVDLIHFSSVFFIKEFQFVLDCSCILISTVNHFQPNFTQFTGIPLKIPAMWQPHTHALSLSPSSPFPLNTHIIFTFATYITRVSVRVCVCVRVLYSYAFYVFVNFLSMIT